MEKIIKSDLLQKMELFATAIIINYPERVVYHDIKFAHRYLGFIRTIATHNHLSEVDIENAQLAGWLLASAFNDQKISLNKETGAFENNNIEEAHKLADQFLPQQNIPNERIELIKNSIMAAIWPNLPSSGIENTLADALTADIIMGKPKKHLKQIYEEILLHDVPVSKNKWYDISIGLASQVKLHSEHCVKEMQPKLDELILSLQKDKKQLDKQTDLALKKEFNISDLELKQLKKNLANSKGRDDRGIQTVFRTTSKNHYTLNEMVDRKSSIMITVNSIILSLILGGVLEESSSHGHVHITWESLPILVLTIGCAVSIIFAILAIRPNDEHGQFTEEEIRNKKGNILFYGNFHKMHQEDYEWAFLQMMNDQDYLYSTMVKDIYFLGKNLGKKFSFVRKSLTIFLVCLVSSVLLNLIIRIGIKFI